MNILYDDDIVFDFYSRSDNSPYPGEGINEKMNEVYKAQYIELSQIPEWRKKLSNFWIQTFTIDDLKWASVEHYFQACHFKINNPDFYYLFSLNSGSELSKDPVFAKKAGYKKPQKYRGVLSRDKNIKIDETFYTDNNHIKTMYKAQYEKFTQNTDLCYLLKLTYEAKLQHTVIFYEKSDKNKMSDTEVFDSLMIIRSIISSSSKK